MVFTHKHRANTIINNNKIFLNSAFLLSRAVYDVIILDIGICRCVLITLQTEKNTLEVLQEHVNYEYVDDKIN